MQIIKNNDVIILKEDETIIEEYKFNEEINFSKLMSSLLKLNLSKLILLEDRTTNTTPEEENLKKLIANIINDYNSKVAEFQKFKEEHVKKN